MRGFGAARRSRDRARFEYGASNVLLVNLREQAAADAQLHTLDAQFEVGVARAAFTTAVGRSLAGRLQ
jgi:hypothetical protein